MHILLLGGGIFLGQATLAAALASGHAVTVFNRGRARSMWPQGVEVLVGDRQADLAPLADRRWDAVVDTSGYVPADVRSSAEALAGCGCYLFVSTVSAYASTAHAPVLETDALAAFDHLAPDDRDPAHYGAQKAACEAQVQRVFGPRALIVRPGLIVGPGDPTGRFGHWPHRVARGGEMLVPNVPEGWPVQVIDARDLGAWMVSLLEQQARGTFNATGPAGGDARAHGWPELLATCREAVQARGGRPATAVPVDEAFLLAHEVAPWSALPLWLPSSDPAYLGFNRIDVRRAEAAGLRTRSLRETVDAALDEPLPTGGGLRNAGRLTAEREAQLLAAWAAR